MDDIFKKSIQDFLRPWNVSLEKVDFNKVTDFDSLWNLLGIEDELCFKPNPTELVEGLKIICSLYEKGIDPATIRRHRMFSYCNGEWEMAKPLEEDKLIEKCWSEDVNEFVMGNSNSLWREEYTMEDLETKIVEEIEYYKSNDKSPNIKKFKERLRKFKLILDIYDKTKYQKEIYKIIYYFYDLKYNRILKFLKKTAPPASILEQEIKDRVEFDVVDFLKNPSTESVDYSFLDLGLDTHKGNITKFIKYPLKKELGVQKTELIEDYLDFVESTWFKLIFQMRRTTEQGIKIDFCRATQDIQSLIDLQSKIFEWKHLPVSPIETLYFRIAAFERMGELESFLLVNQKVFPVDYNVPLEFVDQMKKWKNETIKIQDAEKFVKQIASKIAKYVYLKWEITDNEMDRMNEHIWKIPLLLDFCKRANPNVATNDEVTILRIISCLQAILTDKEDNFEYTFYLYQMYVKHPQTDALKKDKHMVDTVKLYWVRRINNHFNANLREYETRRELEQYENKIYKLLYKLFSYPTYFEMLAMNSLTAINYLHADPF